MNISVIIATRNRPDQLLRCLRSLIQNSLAPKEIIVIDQGDISAPLESCITKAKHRHISVRHIRTPGKNLSHARNEGVRLATGDICAFTDDDCVVSGQWIHDIADSFYRYPSVSGVFGSTKPYQPSRHKHLICPCVTDHKTPRVITQPERHWDTLGFGNNMAFRKIVCSDHRFQTWLGLGSVSKSAEDAEFALHVLIRGKTLLASPRAVVYHDKWLTKKESAEADLSYTRGEAACYGYYSFSGYVFADSVVRQNVHRFITQIRKKIVDTDTSVSLIYEVRLFRETMIGVCIGLFKSLTQSPNVPRITSTRIPA